MSTLLYGQLRQLTGIRGWRVPEYTVVDTQLQLTPEHGRRLAEISAARGSTAEEVIADLIDRAYALESRARRLALVAEIGQLEIEDPPESAMMHAQLAEAHGRPDLP